MNRKVYIAILSFLVLVSQVGCMSEDSNSLDPSEIFIKYYGSESAEETIDLLELNDGFLLLGSRTDAENTDFYLVRTDSSGNRLWEGIIHNDYSDETVDIPSKMFYDEDNDDLYIIGTSTFDITDDDLDRIPVDHLYLASIKIESTGFSITDTLLYRYYEDRVSSTAYEEGYRPTSGADVIAVGGQLIILGSVTTGSNNPALDDNSILLMKISSDFQTVDWERIKGFSGDDFGKSLLVANGNYYYSATITTTSGIGEGGLDVLVEQFDFTSGNEDNQTDYGTVNNEEASNMIFTNPGIALVGTTGTGSNQYAFLLRLSSSLGAAQLVPLTYPRDADNPDQTWNTQGADLAQSSSGDFYIVGKVNSFSDASADPREDEIMILSTNGIGEVNEGDVQEYGSVQDDGGNAIIRRADGSMVIGATVHFGGSATMMSLLKTNKKGEFLRN
ncbi:hypothetical protein SAMN04488029_3587 [Reichenbachiella faecimaris]|uniref:Delta-60 repeat domain-containing protein n=1 Tax=Reichenbachiella faecimaris TaxID=692418 RepID=A0A1W2GMW6_REIFA|nr:hypothetical protein [Reichenbachiella faecimaris]SMD38009.1 hypothetical protein SAMN04488029_3587 [Reichenbachiella faecimaris]